MFYCELIRSQFQQLREFELNAKPDDGSLIQQRLSTLNSVQSAKWFPALQFFFFIILTSENAK